MSEYQLACALAKFGRERVIQALELFGYLPWYFVPTDADAIASDWDSVLGNWWRNGDGAV